MPRVLLLMPTHTYRAEAFLKAGERLGVDVTVGTEREHVLAALTPSTMTALDFRDERRARRQVRDFHARFPVDAVVGVDDETTVLAAVAAEELGLPHNSVSSAKAARYKDVMRLALAESGVRSPAFQVFGLDEDPRAIGRRVSYPCVVKPLTLSASRGVIRADTPEELVAAFHVAAEVIAAAHLDPADPASRQVLVEDFIPGREVALEGLLVDGELVVLALFDKPDPLDGPYFEETIYVTPSRLPAAQQADVVDTAAQAAAALGLREGPIHAELRVNDRGAWVVEVAARSIGGLCSNVLRFGSDVALEEILLRQAARLDATSLQREGQPVGVMMIPVPAEGILCGVGGLDAARAVAGIEQVTISIPLGGRVVQVPRADRYLGFIFARGNTPAAVERSLRQAHAQLRFDIQPAAAA